MSFNFNIFFFLVIGKCNKSEETILLQSWVMRTYAGSLCAINILLLIIIFKLIKYVLEYFVFFFCWLVGNLLSPYLNTFFFILSDEINTKTNFKIKFCLFNVKVIGFLQYGIVGIHTVLYFSYGL